MEYNIREEYSKLNDIKRDYDIAYYKFLINIYKPIISYYRANNFKKFKEYVEKVQNILNDEKFEFYQSIKSDDRNYIGVFNSILQMYLISPHTKFNRLLGGEIESLIRYVKEKEEYIKSLILIREKSKGINIITDVPTTNNINNLIDFD